MRLGLGHSIGASAVRKQSSGNIAAPLAADVSGSGEVTGVITLPTPVNVSGDASGSANADGALASQSPALASLLLTDGVSRLLLADAASAEETTLVVIGDSISTPTTLTTQSETYPDRLQTLIEATGSNVNLVRIARAGASWDYDASATQTLHQKVVSELATAVASADRAAAKVVFFAGTNGIALGSNTGADEYADFVTTFNYVTGLGFAASNCAVVAMLPRQGVLDYRRYEYNELLIAGAATHGYKIVRLDQNLDFGKSGGAGVTYWYPDTIHPSTYAHDQIAETIYDALYDATWTPASLVTAGRLTLEAHFDAQDATSLFSDDGVTQAANTNAVYRWNDKSGNGRHVRQTTLANRPLLASTSLNGLPGLDFDASNDWLDSGVLSANIGSAIGYLIVERQDGSGNQQWFDMSTDNASSDTGATFRGQALNYTSRHAGTQSNVPGADAIYTHVIAGMYSKTTGAPGRFAVDGSHAGANQLSPITEVQQTGFRIGAGFSSGFRTNGPIGEIAFFRHPTLGYTPWIELDRLTRYAKARWGNIDTTPADFTLTPVTGAAINTITESNTITISGLNTAALVFAISPEGASSVGFSKNGAAYVGGTTVGYVENGDTLKVRVQSSGSAATTLSAILRVGTVEKIFTVRTA